MCGIIFLRALPVPNGYIVVLSLLKPGHLDEPDPDREKYSKVYFIHNQLTLFEQDQQVKPL